MTSTIRAELRAVHWSPVVGGLAAAAGLAVLDLTVWPGGPGSQLLWLVAGLLGGSVAVALDDPAATLTRADADVGNGGGRRSGCWSRSSRWPAGAGTSRGWSTRCRLPGRAGVLARAGPDRHGTGARGRGTCSGARAIAGRRAGLGGGVDGGGVRARPDDPAASR